MFNAKLKKQFNELLKSIGIEIGYAYDGGLLLRSKENSIFSKIDRLEDKINGYASCEICGCLVENSKIIKGKSEIRTKEHYIHYPSITKKIEYIHTPKYCKHCAPKNIK